MGQGLPIVPQFLCSVCDFAVRKAPQNKKPPPGEALAREAIFLPILISGRQSTVRMLLAWVFVSVRRVLVLHRMIHSRVVLVPVDFAAYVILFMIHLRALLAGQVPTIRRTVVVHLLVDASFLAFDVRGLMRRQLA